MNDNDTSELGRAVQEVSERASLLVREEIALAKAEITLKAMGLARAAAIGAAAGVFVLAGLIYFLHFLALLIWRVLDPGGQNVWLGYLIVTILLFVLAIIAGFTCSRLIKKSSPPVPTMAIEEAQLIKQTLTAPHPVTPTIVPVADPAKPEVRS